MNCSQSAQIADFRHLDPECPKACEKVAVLIVLINWKLQKDRKIASCWIGAVLQLAG